MNKLISVILNIRSWVVNTFRKFLKKHGIWKKFQAYTIPSKVRQWQERERKDLGYVKMQKGVVDMVLAKKLHKEMLRDIKYISDKENYGKKEYWASSKEVIERMQDDCDGQAVYMWRKLRDAGFPDDKIGICIVKQHAFCIIIINDKDFWLLDNGAISRQIVKASNTFPIIIQGVYREPLYGFNLFDYWLYGGVK